jgi:hypothetical protein
MFCCSQGLAVTSFLNFRISTIVKGINNKTPATANAGVGFGSYSYNLSKLFGFLEMSNTHVSHRKGQYTKE